MKLLGWELWILKLRWTSELSWGEDEDEAPERVLFHHLEPVEVPEVELEEDELEDGLGFRLR